MEREFVSDLIGMSALSLTTVVLLWLPALMGI